MNPTPTARTLTLTALVALALLPAAAVCELDPGRIGWSELDFEASKLGLSIESRLRIRRFSRAEIERALTEPGPGEWLPPPISGGWLLNLDTAGLGKRSRLALILDSSGASLQRTQIETGRRLKHYRSRTHRFARGAVHVGARRPAPDERQADPGDWSESSEFLLELPSGPQGAIGQASGLFFTLGAASLLEPGDRVSTYVLSKGRVMRVVLAFEARERVNVNYVEIDGPNERRRRGKVDTLRVHLSGRGVDTDAAESEFRFAGLRGNVRVHLDPVTRAPLLITGRVDWLGRAKIRLRRLVLGRH